ncbi:hypothetical protein COOONC_05199 [Cooperia oncophora]
MSRETRESTLTAVAKEEDTEANDRCQGKHVIPKWGSANPKRSRFPFEKTEGIFWPVVQPFDAINIENRDHLLLIVPLSFVCTKPAAHPPRSLSTSASTAASCIAHSNVSRQLVDSKTVEEREDLVLSRTPKVVEAVRKRIARNATRSISTMARDMGISRKSMERVVHEDLKMYPYRTRKASSAPRISRRQSRSADSFCFGRATRATIRSSFRMRSSSPSSSSSTLRTSE